MDLISSLGGYPTHILKVGHLKATIHLNLEQQLDPLQWSHHGLAHCGRHTLTRKDFEN